MNEKHESTIISYSAKDSLAARQEIFGKLASYPATPEETERSLGLFLRGSLLARILAIRDIYVQIVDLPGIIMDIGTWRGQTAVLCENLRAIHEPLHFNRRIVCFDTFEGYQGFSEKDWSTDIHHDGTYGVGGESYASYLRDLLILHEQSNAMGHNYGKHDVVSGDCRQTIPEFFEKKGNEFVALAFFDVNSYEPSLSAFQAVWERMVPGGIAAFWQLTRDSIPAEAMVYVDHILNEVPHKLRRSETYPGLCYVQKT